MKQPMAESPIQNNIKENTGVSLPASGRGYTWRLVQPKNAATTMSPNVGASEHDSGEASNQKSSIGP